MFDLWWEICQEGRISDAKADARRSVYDATKALSTAETFQRRIDKMAILIQAMWSLLSENTNLTEEDLKKRVVDIDMIDGKLDGKVSKKPLICKKCGAGISRRFNKCVICGEPGEYTNEMDSISR